MKPNNLNLRHWREYLKRNLPMKKFLSYTVYFLFSSPLLASTASTGMPWESPLNVIQRSLTGPVAMSICIIAFFTALGSLIFRGDELSGFTKTLVMLVLVGAGLASVTSVVTTLFNVSGAIIA